MKNTIRVRKNRIASRSLQQVKTNFGKEFKMPKDAKHHACLAIFDREHQMPVRKIPLTEQEFFDLWAFQFKGEKKYTDETVAEIIRQKLYRPAPDIDELELAITQSNALAELLSDKLDQIVNCDRTPWTGEHGMSIISGIRLLVQTTQDRLHKIYAETYAALTPMHSKIVK